jgi:hypothetical protein
MVYRDGPSKFPRGIGRAEQNHQGLRSLLATAVLLRLFLRGFA